MNNFDWESFLRQESQKAIAKYKKDKNKYPKDSWTDNIVLPSSAIESEWLGLPGALEEQIVAAENRLGVKLPPSYREFLKVTNGWCNEYPGTPILRSVEDINWLYVENQDWIDEWMTTNEPVPDEEYFVYDQDWWYWRQALRTEYMQTALQISDDDDGDVVLLNPKIIHNHEWEAWVLSCAHAGVNRCRSFREILQKVGMVDSWV